MPRSAAPRTGNINIRVSPETLGLIDRAAKVFGKTRTDFILETMRKAAEDAILDQRNFFLDEHQWIEFNRMLNATPRDNPELRALLARKPAWQE